MMGRKKSTSSKLKHLLKLQQEVRISDGQGGYSRTWQDVTNLWAEILPYTGKEVFFGGQIQASITHRILLRHTKDINTGQRLVFENRAFNIRTIHNVAEEDHLLQLLVEEGVASS